MLRTATLCLSAYWLAIFVATHIPSSAMPSLSSSDKVQHLLAFSGLSFLLAWALPTREGKWLSHMWLAAGIGLGYGCLDEFTQNFIPGRVCDFWDLVADAAGIAVGLTAYLVARQLLSHHRLGRRLIHSLSR